MYHLQSCYPFSYACGKPMACTVWPPQRHRWCDTVAEMLRLLHTVSCQMLAKLKQNHPRKVHLYFHGLQTILIRSTCSFHFHCLYLILALCTLISFFFSFHCIMPGHCKGAGGKVHFISFAFFFLAFPPSFLPIHQRPLFSSGSPDS